MKYCIRDIPPSLRAWALLGPALLLLQALLAIACLADEEQMYVIASEPFPSADFNAAPAILYRVEGDQLQKARTITTTRQDTLFVHPYPDQGYVFVGSVGARPGSFLLDIVELNNVSVERTLDLDGCWGCNTSNYPDHCTGCRYATSHLLNREGRLIYMIRPGIRYVEQLDCACRDLGVDIHTGETISGLGTGDLRYAYLNGAPGGLVDGGEFGAVIAADGMKAVARAEEEVRGHDLGWELPPALAMVPGSWRQAAQVMIDNDLMRVLAPVVSAAEPQTDERLFYVYEKASGEWSELTLPGSGVPMVELRYHVSNLDMSGLYFPMRAFREWLAAEEIDKINVYEPRTFDLEGLAEQRFGSFRSAAERSKNRKAALSGRFRLFNARTKDLIVHDTGEPNSEVLYVDEEARVYYRVSDELRRARIQDGRLEKSMVLVKVPELWAVHWLFVGHE